MAQMTLGIFGPNSDESSRSFGQASSSESRSHQPTDEIGLAENLVCSECSTSKPFSQFYKSKDCLSGFRQPCKTCWRAREKARKDAIPKEQRAANFAHWRRTNRARALVALAKSRAEKKGLDFSLDQHVREIQGVIDAGVCELTGIPFNLDGGKTWDSPSIDRIDSSKGYTLSNVRVVLYCVNVMANLWGENKIVEISDAIMAIRRSKSESLQSRLESALKAQIDTQSSPEFVLTWKTLNMRSGAPICALRGRRRRTSDSGFSGWPAPTAADSGRCPADDFTTKNLTLNHAATLTAWPTCKSSDGDKGAQAEFDRKGTGADLPTIAQLAAWATPTASEKVRSTEFAEGRSPNAREALAGWGTPRSNDGTLAMTTRMPPSGDMGRLELQVLLSVFGTGSTSSNAETENCGALNPEFSRWLMGYPAAWGCCAATAMQSCRKRQQNSSARSLKPNKTNPFTAPDVRLPFLCVYGGRVMEIQTWDDLQALVGQWSQTQFGDNESPELRTRIGSVAAVLGIVEEFGELDEATDHAGQSDAIADAMIFSLDYAGRAGLSVRRIIDRLPPPPSPAVDAAPTLPPSVYLGKLCHAVLKRHQAIRGYQSVAVYATDAEWALGKIVESLRDRLHAMGFDLFVLARDVFVREVSKRDWRNRPTTG